MEDTKDRVSGLLLGLAAGDYNGGPIRLAIRLAKSLHDRGGFDVSNVGKRYLNWWNKGAFDTGPTTAKVLSLVATGVSFEKATVQVDQKANGMTAGCNPAHRSAVLAMCVNISNEQLADTALAEACLTHRHPLAGDVAAATTRLCRALIRGTPWPEALEWAGENRLSETQQALKSNSDEGLSMGGFAPDVLAAAIYFTQSSNSFSEALRRSLDFAGPENYCPVLAGSIGGAKWGQSQIDVACHHYPRDLMPQLLSVAQNLVEGW